MFLHKKIVSSLAIIALVFSLLMPIISVNAAGISSASDTLSTSDRSVTATNTISFTTSVPHGNLDYFEITFPGTYGTLAAASVTCPAGYTASFVPGTRVLDCLSSGAHASGTQQIVVTNLANPGSVGSYLINIKSYLTGGVTIHEQTNVMVAIVDHVTMTAAVTSNLVFEVKPVATSTLINGATTTAASATTTINFGTLTAGNKYVIGQELRVTTNATNGYNVTVEQNQDLTSGSNAKIDSFVDGIASTTAQTWVAPSANLADTATYGHMGVTTSDVSLNGAAFGSDKFKGFSGITPMQVMYHTGPADGTSTSVGMAQIGYALQISGLQEAGDYTNTLTYIATPRF